MKTAPARVQRAERKKHINQGLCAGLGIVFASQQAAHFARHKYGLVLIRDDEPHYLYELGLDMRESQGGPPSTPLPPVIRRPRSNPHR